MSIEKNGLILPGEPEYVRNAHGAFIADGVEVALSLLCPHCNSVFLSIRGSGKRRAYCFKCSAVTCGAPACDECVPWEKQLEEIERQSKVG